ncbi:MAG: hypothetical protein HC788_03155 [Sphingopyxis sp.]|nr:hypothetical protein [Sphingopyxis sp.]
MKTVVLLCAVAALLAVPAVAAPVTPSCKEAASQQSKPPVRKPSEPRKRAPSPSVGKGCVGCIVPFDGISSLTAVRSLG